MIFFLMEALAQLNTPSLQASALLCWPAFLMLLFLAPVHSNAHYFLTLYLAFKLSTPTLLYCGLMGTVKVTHFFFLVLYYSTL